MSKTLQTFFNSVACCCAVVLLLVVAPSVSADDTDGASTDSVAELNPASPLEDYFRVAALNHPSLKASFERWSATASIVAAEKGWPDPVISYGYFIESVETAVGPQQHRIALSQTIPWFGKLSTKGTAAEQAALAAEQDYEADRLRLYERVSKAYYEYAYLAEATSVTEENLTLLTQVEAVARARYRTKSAIYSELIKAQVEQGVLEDRLNTLRDRRAAVAARLNETLGRDSQSTLPWPVSLAPPEYAAPDADEVRDQILRQNPQLLSLDSQILASESRVEAEGKNGLPDFNLGVQTILTGESELTSFSGQGKDAWILTFAMSVPLWRGQYSGAEDAARASQRMLEYRYEDQRINLLAEAEDVLFHLRDAERKVDLYGASLIPKARQSLEATAQSFQTGEVTFLDFVDAQRTLLMFQLDHARARADYGIQVMSISRLVGVAPIDPQSGNDGEPGTDPHASPDPGREEQRR